MEEWKEVLGFDVLYEVSNLGRVRTRYSKEKGYTKEYRFVEPTDNGKGYMRFNWKLNGRSKTVYLHRLVAEYFIFNPEGLTEVNHKDENKSNNSADNLEWCTHLYNCEYGTRNIRTAALNSKKIICVETGMIYDSVTDAAKRFGVCITSMSNCLNGRSKSCSGYTWRYLDVHA